MRKIFSITLFSLVALSAVMLSSCKKEETVGEVRILSLYITPTQTVMEMGDTAEINVYASYSNGSCIDVTLEDDITITSSDGNIVSYKDGKIVGKGMGKVKLTASYMGLSDNSEAISAELDHLVLTANYDDNKVLMLPLDTLNKKTDLTLTAVLKLDSSNEEYEKTIDPDNYTIEVDDPEKLEILEGDTLIVAKESATTYLTATYKHTEEGWTDANVFVAKYDGGELKLDVDITSESTDVMLLGSEAGIKAEANFVWEGVKKKEKGKEADDTSTTVDIASKVQLFSENPPLLGVNKTTVSALQIGDGGVYAYYTATETVKDTLTRKVCVLNEKSLKTTSYNIELADTSVYAGEELNFKFYANYIRVNDGDTTKFRVDLTNTHNIYILSTVLDTASMVWPSLHKCNGKESAPELESPSGYNVVVEYEHSPSSKDTVYSKPVDVYSTPFTNKVADSLFIGTYVNDDGKLFSVHNDYKVKDHFGNDLTDKFNIYKEGTSYRFGIPLSEVRKRTLTITYGPKKREVSVYVDEQ